VNLAELATMGMLLAVLIGMAATTLVCVRPRPQRCAACLRRIRGRHPAGGCAMTAVIPSPSEAGNAR